MASNMNLVARRLIGALNTRGYNITMSIKQFMGRERVPINFYCINNAEWDDEGHRYLNNQLYSTTSMRRVVYFLRDLWYLENNIPLTNEDSEWVAIRAELFDKGVLIDG